MTIRLNIVICIALLFCGSASAEKINSVSVSMEPAIPPSPGSLDFNVDAELDKCCGLGGGGNFQFSLRWSFHIGNGAAILTGLQPVYPAPSPVHALFQFHLNGTDLSNGNHLYSMFTEYVRFHLDASGNVISEHVFGTNTTSGTFVIDTTPPAITVNGVFSDQIYTVARTITYSASDPNLSSVVATLNGNAFPSGGIVASDGPYALVITALDAYGNITTKRTEFRIWTSLPPEPSTVAPQIDPTLATNFCSSIEFLFSGNNPTQIGVEPGTIVPRRATVVRGKVKALSGTPLSGVKVSILNHPELGATVSRSDGMFDLVVNGGGILHVVFEKPDHITVHRSLTPGWERYEILEDVAILPYDEAVTEINFADPMQMARGSIVTDEDGTRRSTLLFPQQVVTLVLPDGTEQQLTTIHVRATEFTVGPYGSAAMPAELPPTSAYTYAVEFSVDEAIAVGATEVRFAAPVISYVENFLNLPTGQVVPLGYYDRNIAQWIPSDNGRIVKIVSVTNGLANYDYTGDDLPDNPQAIGISDLERTAVAAIYQPGQILWRVTLTHFTGWDKNWSTIAAAGDEPRLRKPDVRTGNPEVEADLVCGSIIDCQNQTLGESIGVIGTGFNLFYQSERIQHAAILDITLNDENTPGNVKGIELLVEVAGRSFTQSFQNTPNQHFSYSWDGKDVYGRNVYGKKNIKVRIGYVYDAHYLVGPDSIYAFAAAIGIPIVNGVARSDVTKWQEHQVEVSLPPVSTVAGWTFNVHHVFDPAFQYLYKGDGNRRQIGGVINTIAGTGNVGSSGDGGQAIDAEFWLPTAVDSAADGSLYVADWANRRVRKIDSEGTVTAFAGGGDPEDGLGDGGPAVDARMEPVQLAVGPDGSVFIVDTEVDQRIRKVDSSGIITTFAGGGQIEPHLSEGLPATDAVLSFPTDVAVAMDGTVYIADTDQRRVFRVAPDGRIYVFAGNGLSNSNYNVTSGDGGPARSARFSRPTSLAIAQDGSVYIGDTSDFVIRRVGPDGVVTRVAGMFRKYGDGTAGNGGPADEAQIGEPWGLAFSPDGTLYFSAFFHERIRKIDSRGIIGPVAGNGDSDFSGDGGYARQASLHYSWFVTGLAILPNGAMYIPDKNNNRVRQIGLVRRLANNEYAIADEGGSEIYIFDQNGRHLRTVDSFSNGLIYQFGYDSQGNLSSISDTYGNITTVQWNGAGEPTAIIAPFGQVTTLTTDPVSGLIATISDPLSNTTQLSYTQDGLLTELITPNGQRHSFDYDPEGRLILDEDPAGGSLTLTRAGGSNTYNVNLTSKMNRERSYFVDNQDDGDQHRVNTDESGLVVDQLIRGDGTRTITYPDGSVVDIREGPDPRFNLQFPVLTELKTTLSSGLVSEMKETRQVTLSDEEDPFSLTTLTETFDINGRIYTSLFHAASLQITNTTPEGRQSYTLLDSSGRVTQSQFASLALVEVDYDIRGRVQTIETQSGSERRTAYFDYDPNGFLQSITDPLNRTVSFRYDGAGRLRVQVLPDNRQIEFDYDPNGNLRTLTPPGRPLHSFVYTPIDFLDTYDPPAASIPLDTTRYLYNLDQQVTSVNRPDGSSISVGYDGGGRINSITTSRGTTLFSYHSTNGTLTSLAAPDAVGLAFTYDGSLLKSSTLSGPVTGSVSWNFDSSFRMTSESVNSSNPVTFRYDDDSFPTQIGILSIARNPQNGFIDGTTLGSISDARGYNGFGEMTSLDVPLLYSTTYTRDKLGRIAHKIENIQGQTDRYDYMYDTMGRLTDVLKNNVPVVHYDYDSNSNRLPGNYDAQDRLLQYGKFTFAYTANGELQSKTDTTTSRTTTYNYDEVGSLVTTTLPDGTLIEYIMDGANRRIGKKVNGVKAQGFLYRSGLQVIAELDTSNNVVSRFVYATRANVPDYMIKSGVTYRIISDHLGSPRLVVDSFTGTVAQRMDYSEFGNVTFDSNPGFQPFGFAGGLYDQHTQLVRFGARDYDPSIGRWTTKDAILFAGGDTNLYGYVLNDPINFIDPVGLQASGMAQLYMLQALGNSLPEISNAEFLGIVAAADVGLVGGIAGLEVAPIIFVGHLSSTASTSTGAACYTVYRSINALGDVQYVGITKNFLQRAMQHAGRFQIEPVVEGLIKFQARGSEQALINLHGLSKNGGTLLNKINSIAVSNPIYADALNAGKAILNKCGCPGF